MKPTPLKGESAMKMREAVISACIVFLACSSLAPAATNDVTKWNFLSEADYYVPEPNLLEIDTAPPGNAQLILQAQAKYHSTAANYDAGSLALAIAVGPAVSLNLSGLYGAYNNPGRFTSRVLDGGVGNIWEMINARASNFLFDNSMAEMSPTKPGLVTLWRMNNNWQDATMGGRHLTPSGSAFSSLAKYGSHSGYFANSYAYRNLSDTLGLTNTVTIAAWLRADYPDSRLVQYAFSLGVGSSWLLAIRTGGYWNKGNEPSYCLSVQANSPVGYASTSAGGFTTAQDGSVWRHVVITYDRLRPVRTRIFKDAIPQDLFVNTVDVDLSGVDNITVGTRSDRNWSYGGLIDELAVFNYAMTQDQVRDLYYAGSALRFRLRSGATQGLSGDFVGPDGTVESCYFGSREALVSAGSFNVFDRYLQYQVDVLSSAYNNQTPSLTSLGLYGSAGVQFDSALNDFFHGTYNYNVTNTPGRAETPYVSSGLQPNGGSYSNGIYVSEAFDKGHSVNWESLKWGVGREWAATG
ncbi:MAG: LamG domain-containing protein, partial [Planctomycetes bacterium]|nr:LamG domain-containing protein [Planctomycetota bacterium]